MIKIPGFDLIEKDYTKNLKSGEMIGTCLFVDISGFTELTEKLMIKKDEGAEELSQIINGIFSVLTEKVYDNGGVIIQYAGDAFYAVFTENATYGALNASLMMMNEVRRVSEKTSGEKFRFDLKIGMSFGTMYWNIIGSKKDRIFYFQGDPIRQSAKNETNCDNGEIIIDNTLKKSSGLKISVKEKKKGVFKLLGIEKIPQVKIKNIINDNDLLQDLYYYNKISNLQITGEFRVINSVFVYFGDIDNKEGFISVLFNKCKEYRGFLSMIDFGDKGPMAFIIFGAPISHENDTERSILFSMDILKSSENMIKIGVSTGPAFAGMIGCNNASAYTVLSKDVNLSARLMQNANIGEIMSSEKTVKDLGNKIKYKKRGEYSFKGFKEKQRVYSIFTQKLQLEKVDQKKKFYGRKDELQKVLDKIDLLKRGKCQGLTYIYGNPGEGKTSFLKQIKQYALNKVNVISLRTDSILKKSFNPFIEYFSDLFSLRSCLDFDTEWEKLIVAMNRPGNKNEMSSFKPYIKRLLGMDDRENVLIGISSEEINKNSIWSIKEMLKALSKDKPLILIIEDIQWLDIDTAKFFKRFFINLEDFPIFVISSSRFSDDGSEPAIRIDGNMRVEKIILKPLENSDISNIIKDIIGYTPSIELLDTIIERSSANPFYIEQVSLYLLENEMIEIRKEKAYLLFDIKKLPQNINSIMIARIDRLSEELKHILRHACILGKEINVTILSKMLKNENLTKYLEKGYREQIWEKVTDLKYIFSHALLQEAAYEMQLKKRLKNLHMIAAKAFEEIDDGKEIHLLDIAYHYDRSGLSEKAVIYLDKAYVKMKSSYKTEETMYCLDALIRNVKEDEKKTWKLNKAKLLGSMGRIREGEKLLLELYDAEKEKEISVYKYDVMIELIGNYLNSGNMNCLEKYLEELKSQITGKIGKEYFFQVHKFQAMSVYFMGDYPKALKIINDLCDAKDKLTSPSEIYQMQTVKAMTYMNMGLLQEAEKLFLELKKECDHEYKHIRIDCNLSTVYLMSDQLEKAKEALEQNIVRSKKYLDRIGLAYSLGNLAFIYFKEGKDEKSLKYALEYEDICIEIGDNRGLTRAYTALAGVYNRQNKVDKALHYYKIIKNLNKELRSTEIDIVIFAGISDCLKLKGEIEEALRYLKKAERIAKRTKDMTNLHYIYFTVTGIYQKKRDREGAIRYLKRSLNLKKTLKEENTDDILYDISLQYYKIREYKKAENYLKRIRMNIQNDQDKFFTFWVIMLMIRIQLKLNKKIKSIPVGMHNKIKYAYSIARDQKNEKCIKFLEKNFENIV